jgi:predicted TIM-barrel fold metal-dependent hydrolase
LTPESLVEETLSAEGIQNELDKGGVERGFLFSVYAPRSVGVSTNEFVVSQIEKSERLYGVASLSVDEWEEQGEAQLSILQTVLQHPKMIGIKLAHTHQHFRMDDPRYFPIYEIAGQSQAPVYVHTGPSPFPGTNPAEPYINPLYLEEAIQQYPQTQFILGHMCYDFINRKSDTMERCYQLAQTYDNIWLEPSAFGSRTSDPEGTVLTEMYTYIKENGLIEKMIYGSDGPQSPGFLADYAQRNIEAMRNADYSAAEVERVLSGSAIELYQLPEYP